MKITPTLKTLVMFGLTSLSLAAASSQAADSGYLYFGGNPNPNPWVAPPPNANPWLANPAYQQARAHALLKQRQAELDQRQDAQMQRILNGMENGKLTSREAVELIREHVDIAKLERSYMTDGRLGPNELNNLERRLDEANRHIRGEMKDRERIGHPGEMQRPGDMRRPGDMDRR